MIRAFVSLVLVAGLVLAPAPAQAVTFAECQAFLCLPGGFPPRNAARQAAVLLRLSQLKPALPSWSSCAAAFGWDSANLRHTEPRHEECDARRHAHKWHLSRHRRGRLRL